MQSEWRHLAIMVLDLRALGVLPCTPDITPAGISLFCFQEAV